MNKCKVITKEKVISKKEIAQRMHQHGYLTSEKASSFKRGSLDVDLLKFALGVKIEEIDSDEFVAVRFSTLAMNILLGREEPVFDVTSSSGRYVGSFFACAFREFSI